jgi:hypothetical protein
VGLLSPCNRILTKKPPIVWLNSQKQVLAAIIGCRTLLRESTKDPTRCKELVSGWPDFIGIVDASSHGVGGVVMGETSLCIPTVFRWEWPQDVTASVRSFSNPTGTIINSDLEMAGVLILWLVMEAVCQLLQEKRVALFSVTTRPRSDGQNAWLLANHLSPSILYRHWLFGSRPTKLAL